MSIAYVNQSGPLGTGSSASSPPPPGTQAGDVLICTITTGTACSPSVPSGWTRHSGTSTKSHLFTKVATASEPSSYVFNFGVTTDFAVIMAAYRGASATYSVTSSSQAYSSGATITTPTTASPTPSLTVACVNGSSLGADTTTAMHRVYSTGSVFTSVHFCGMWDRGPGVSPDVTFAAGSPSGTAWMWSVGLVSSNNPPNAPTLTSPANLALIDRSITQRFAWLFSDPDAGDSQSKFDLQWWPCDASWARTGTATTVSSTTPNQFYDFAANYWAAGNFEWQVRTYDSQGVVGPWSSSSFFTAATAPTPPTITAPTSGGTVPNVETVTWSEPNQDSYQIRRVADNAGSADTSTIYYDSGEVVDSVSRSATLTFETNNRWEHIEVRVKYGGLWSAWSDIRVDVSYTPPPAPTVALTPDAASGSLAMSITNPAPGSGQPATSYNDVYVDDGQGLGWERVATMLAPSTGWTYALPRSGYDYSGHIKVTAVASNGTTSEAIA